MNSPRTRSAPTDKAAGRTIGASEASQPGSALRIGIGNDVHELVAGKKLILGGVRIPGEKGPRAHSDGDALTHSICDALLGAAGLGDIGQQFPDTAPRWRNASSLLFLRQVRRLLASAGYAVLNVDATVSLERPKLRLHIAGMRRTIARALGVGTEQVSVKAKTGEGLGAVGRGQAVRADAVALIQKSGKAPDPAGTGAF